MATSKTKSEVKVEVEAEHPPSQFPFCSFKVQPKGIHSDMTRIKYGHQLPTIDGIDFVDYQDESQLDDVMRLVGQDLSEPYSVFTYRYFLHRWPQLCILAVPTDDDKSVGGHRRPIGCVVCKIDVDFESNETVQELNNKTEPIYDQTDKIITLDTHKIYSGYIGMLAVEDEYRRSGIGTALVERAIHLMKEMGCQSIKLETEVTNKGAMRLYEDRFGFVREELLVKYYLNWGDAYRLRLWLDG